MSLVNDMLRDLDQRRQEPSRAMGAERLVPVASSSRDSSTKRSLVSFILSIAITLSLIIGGIYFWQSFTLKKVPPVAAQPVFSAAPVASSAPSVNQRELEEMALRMQELEAQNRALIEAQAAAATQANQASLQVDAEDAQPIEALPASTPQLAEVAVIESSLEEPNVAPVTESQVAVSVEPELNAEIASNQATPTTSNPIRSPRELSFVERDQLQVQEALRLASSNQAAQAMQGLSEFVRENPNAHSSREAMIKLALQKGDMATANQLLHEGLSIDANRTGYRKLEARVLLSTGQAELAMQRLSTGMPTIAEDVEFHDILATAYLSVQDYEKAAQSYEALVQQNRGEGRWWYGLASAWDSLGRTRDAGLAYEQALKLPNLSAALRQRSQLRIAEMGL